MSTTVSDESVVITRRQSKTLSFEKSNEINTSTGNSSTKKFDFITRLPLELVIDIMKYFEPYELIEMFSISKEWENCLSTTPALWTTWNINKSDNDWTIQEF